VFPTGTNQVWLALDAVNDNWAEGVETVVLQLSSGAGYTLVNPSSATLTILDDEPAVTVTAPDPEAAEPGDNTGSFAISRTGATNMSLTVYVKIGGTASNGVDYVQLPGQFVIPAGETTILAPVSPVDDLATEGSESIELILETNAAYFVSSPATALIVLADDEVNLPPTVAITHPTAKTVFLNDLGGSLVLEASATDDGRPVPPGKLLTGWRQVSGPVAAVFADTNQPNTTVKFAASGVYVLQIVAFDGQLQATDNLTVGVVLDEGLSLGLQAHWRLDESSGTTARDASAYNRSLTLSGARFVPGRFQNAVDFDGADDAASFTSPALTQLTFSAWIRLEGRGDSDTMRVVAMPGYNVRVRWDAANGHSLAFEDERSSSAPQWRTPLNSILERQWYHAAIVFDSSQSSNVPLIYINGAQQALTVVATGSGSQLANTGTGYLGNQSALNRSWDGQIDEVRLYNRRLSSTEVELLSAGPIDNAAPQVDAGPAQKASLRETLNLEGEVTDDGLPGLPAQMTISWTKLSGPGSVTFGDAHAAQTTATFSEVGTYVLRLTASDGQVTICDDVTIMDSPWETWRFDHFTIDELANPDTSGDQADPDGDGLPNLLEYALNLDPWATDATRGFTGTIERGAGTGESYLVVRFTRRKEPSDLACQIQMSSDLKNWSASPDLVQELLPPIDDGNGITETARFRLRTPANQSPQQFLRLRFTLR